MAHPDCPRTMPPENQCPNFLGSRRLGFKPWVNVARRILGGVMLNGLRIRCEPCCDQLFPVGSSIHDKQDGTFCGRVFAFDAHHNFGNGVGAQPAVKIELANAPNIRCGAGVIISAATRHVDSRTGCSRFCDISPMVASRLTFFLEVASPARCTAGCPPSTHTSDTGAPPRFSQARSLPSHRASPCPSVRTAAEWKSGLAQVGYIVVDEIFATRFKFAPVPRPQRRS